MILWSVGTAVLAIWFVFGDPRFDYRTVMIGSVLPVLVDLPTGGAWALHSILASVVLLAVVMLATIGRRPLRRALLGVPLGTFLYLVFSGAWSDQRAFWWPLAGWDTAGAQIPMLDRGLWNVPLEVAGALMLWWIARSAGLADADRRELFLRTGRLTLRANASTDTRC